VTTFKWLRVLSLALAITFALALVACSGDDDDGGSGDDGGDTPVASQDQGDDDSGDDGGDPVDDLDVCSLITEEEASAALGEPITSTEPENFPPLYSCAYDSENGVITLTVATGTRAEVEEIYQIGTEGYEEVSGVGEQAHWSGPPTDTLEVLDGNYDVSISVFSLGAEELDYKQLSIDLVEDALGRLP
jgi:hypothetical protein